MVVDKNALFSVGFAQPSVAKLEIDMKKGIAAIRVIDGSAIRNQPKVRVWPAAKLDGILNVARNKSIVLKSFGPPMVPIITDFTPAQAELLKNSLRRISEGTVRILPKVTLPTLCLQPALARNIEDHVFLRISDGVLIIARQVGIDHREDAQIEILRERDIGLLGG
jgi:hypothetical protein